MDPVADILARGRVLLAPMAGVTEAPFRGICKRFGAGLTYTEMVSVKALYYTPDSTRTRELLTFAPEETPCAVQVFGSDPALMAEQVTLLVERYRDQIAVVDINMGCPVTKVVKKGEGSALMRDPAAAAAIVSAVVAASPLPVTVKMRSGWDPESVNAPDFARTLEAAGASALAVHGRTRDQFYSGRADWDVIAAVKAAVSIPVIGSGDLFTPADIRVMLERTGADAAMVARGSQGNPWIFREAEALLERGEVLDPPTRLERIDMAREHARALVDFGGLAAFTRMRKHVGWYIAEMPGAAHMRALVNDCGSYEELDRLLVQYRDYVESK
jgi:tRNA-dihydrouridine synthase B